jgi:hypothetical protein
VRGGPQDPANTGGGNSHLAFHGAYRGAPADPICDRAVLATRFVARFRSCFRRMLSRSRCSRPAASVASDRSGRRFLLFYRGLVHGAQHSETFGALTRASRHSPIERTRSAPALSISTPNARRGHRVERLHPAEGTFQFWCHLGMRRPSTCRRGALDTSFR